MTSVAESRNGKALSRAFSTLQGPHVTVVSDHVEEPPIFSVEIFARIFLKPGEVAALEKALTDSKPDEAKVVLRGAGAGLKLLAMFDAAVKIKGTGGIPNELSIRDFGGQRADQRSFMVHTQVFLKEEDAAETAARLRELFDARDIDNALALLNVQGDVQDPKHLEAMLRAAL